MLKIKWYIKKPIPVEAVLLTEENLRDVKNWIEENNGEAIIPTSAKFLSILTKEGYLKAYPNKHYIIRGTFGEFYPVEKGIFEATYEEVPEKERFKLTLYEDDLVCVDMSIAKVALIGIEILKNAPVYPPHITYEEWQKVLEEMEKGFKILLGFYNGAYDHLSPKEVEEKIKKVDRAFELLKEYWRWLAK